MQYFDISKEIQVLRRSVAVRKFRFAFTAVLLISVCQLQARDKCTMNISSNDLNAQVLLGDKIVGKTPMEIMCQEQPQKVSVRSSQGQEFSRFMPAREDVNETNRSWNVYFLPDYDRPKQHADTATGQVNYHAQNQDRIHEELVSIRKLLEVLVGSQQGTSTSIDLALTNIKNMAVESQKQPQVIYLPAAGTNNPDGNNVVRASEHVVSSASEVVAKERPVYYTYSKRRSSSGRPIQDAHIARELKLAEVPRSVARPTTMLGVAVESKSAESKLEMLPRHIASVAGVSTNLDGAYVQVYSLISKNFSKVLIKKKLEPHLSYLEGSSLNLCQWNGSKSNPAPEAWTRVFVGPFKDVRAAKEVAGAIGGDSFTVKDPVCHSQLDGVELK